MPLDRFAPKQQPMINNLTVTLRSESTYAFDIIPQINMAICVYSKYSDATLTTLWADSADDKLVIFFFLFFLENRI